MAAPNPYFVNIELYWPDGSRANQNQIARVKAFDVSGSVTTEEGQSGYNPNDGGWYPIYMQHIPAFYPPREKPNLRFEVHSTAEQLVHSTQLFNEIACAATVRITIGVGAELVGGSGSSWLVSGTVRYQNGSLVVSGRVRVFDITAGVEKELGNVPLGAMGIYSVGYATADFSNNGSPHSQPNLLARAYDLSGQLLGESSFCSNASNNQPLDITVPNQTGNDAVAKRRVFGAVLNQIGLPVSAIQIEAYHLAWTVQGIQEFRLGPASPEELSDGSGNYEILYDPPVVAAPLVTCGTDASTINLIVYAKESGSGGALTTLYTSPVIYDAPAVQQVDLFVKKTSSTSASQYGVIDAALSACLGSTESGKWAALNELNERPQYLSFVAQSTGIPEGLVRCYVRAWLIAGEINAKSWANLLSRPMSPEVIYALLQSVGATALGELLDVRPDQFFEKMVSAIHGNIISPSLEAALYPSASYGNKSLLDDWRLILTKMMTALGTWQGPLLSLVYPDSRIFPTVSHSSGTAFGAAAAGHNVPMPGGIAAGDLLLVIFTNTGSATVAVPANWEQIWSTSGGTTGTNLRLGCYRKVAVGNESGANVNFQTNVACLAAAQIYRIPAATWSGLSMAGAGLASSSPARGTGVNINPPVLSQSGWELNKTLWLAFGAHAGNAALVTTPANYVPSPALRTASFGPTNTCTLLSARRERESISEDPASFVISANADWAAGTLAIGAGVVSQASKREQVIGAHFDHPSSFAEALAALRESGAIGDDEAENLTFVFELYERVGRHLPTVSVVYSHKASQNWHNIGDLAKVPLEGSTTGNEWMIYVSQMQSYQDPFPADVPGANASERIRVYANRLHVMFGEVGSQERFASEVAASAPSNPDVQSVAAFLRDHPDFDLERTNVDRFVEGSGVVISDDAVDLLKQYQRTFRLTADFSAVNHLIEEGLGSAIRIARMDEGQFIAAHEAGVGGIPAARRIHRTAAQYASEVFFTLVKFHQNINESGGLRALPKTLRAMALDPTTCLLDPKDLTPGGDEDGRKFPNWITLFGDLNKCACRDCQTALSPGAYLIDLLEFIEGEPRATLFSRRPDLFDLEVTCPNTERALPYIDLVNEILESAVSSPNFSISLTAQQLDQAAGDGTDAQVAAAMQAVRDAFSANGIALGERALVRKSATDQPDNDPTYREWGLEDESYRYPIWGASTTSPPVFAVFPSPQTSPTNDSLEVFPEHFNVNAYETLGSAVFPFNLPLALGREEMSVLLRPRQVSPHHILEAFSSSPGPAALGDPDVALSYLELTEAEAEAILSNGPNAQEYWGFSATSVTIPRPDKPTLTIEGNWVDLMTLVPVFLHRSGLSYPDLLDLLEQDYVQRDVTNEHGLHIAGGQDALLDCNYNDFQVAHLDENALRRISLFLRLRRKLGWSMADINCYLMDIEGGLIAPASVPTTGGSNASRWLQLAQLKRLGDELQLEPRVVFALFTRVDTRRTQRSPRSLFDRVFLSGSSSQPEYLEFEKIARGGSIDLATLATDIDLRATLRGALRLSRDDVELLWSKCVGSSTSITIDIVSHIYRVATFCQALRISVSDYDEIIQLTGVDPLPSAPYPDAAALRAGILNAHVALGEIRTVRSVKMAAAEMHLFLTDAPSAEADHGPSAALMGRVASLLANAASQLAAENPTVANPDADAIATAVGRLIPADKIARTLDILDDPSSSDTAQIDFVQRYFSQFIPASDAGTFLSQLDALTSAAERFAHFWSPLHAHLVDASRNVAAIKLVQEAFDIDEPMATSMLLQGLASVDAADRQALQDWKAMLAGGWDSGLPALEDVAPTAAEPSYTQTGQLLAAKAGQHRFVVRYPSEAVLDRAQLSIAIVVDGITVTPAPGNPKSGTFWDEIEFEPVSLRAGGVYPITFTYEWATTGTPGVSLLMRIENADPSLLASPSIVPLNARAFRRCFKAVRLTKGLALSQSELDYVLANPSLFSLNALPIGLSSTSTSVPWSSLSGLIAALDLNRNIGLKTGTLFEFWRSIDAANPPTDADISTLTGWRERDITVTIAALWPGSRPLWNDAALWHVLRATMSIVRRLDVQASQILGLLLTTDPSIAAAAALRDILRANYSVSTWKEVFKPLRDVLRQRQRDALVGYLTTHPIPVGGDKPDLNFIDANDLFAHYLIDVEMEPDTLISRLKLALNVVQLFIHRVYLGLEGEQLLAVLKSKKDQWTWMEKYRVWEANRKIFLFPENWIEPELRDDKTEFFKELEDELTQAPVTHETALAAFGSYLEKMSEVSNLEVVGTYIEGDFSNGNNFILHVIGRTRVRTRAFYYRTFEGRQAYDGRWNPWQKVPIEIDSDMAVPVVANGRLHLFWLKVHTKERRIPVDEDREPLIDGKNVAKPTRVEYVAEIRVFYSLYNSEKNKWSKPKLSRSTAFDFQAPPPYERDIGEDEARTENYHLRASVEADRILLDLYRTEIPTGPTYYTLRLSTSLTFTFGPFTFRLPERIEVQANLDPKLLGTFSLWYSGHDECARSPAYGGWDVSVAVLPIGTVLKNNAAYDVGFAVVGDEPDDKLAIDGYAAYFESTPESFRYVATNFGYRWTDPAAPFFFETPSTSLFALDKPIEQDPNVTSTAIRRALFSAFNHPQMPAFEYRFHSDGLDGLMHRLTEALPSVADQVCDTNVPTCGCGCGSTCNCGVGGGCTGNSGVGGGCSGNSGVGGGCGTHTGVGADPTNCYLGYYIAGDDRAFGITQRLFEDTYVPGLDTVARPYALPTVDFNYGTAFGIYNWELFFHVPMLIGQRLSQELKFEEAMRWYHHVFDPRQGLNDYELTKDWVAALPEGCRYWTFLPFFANKDAKDSLNDTLGLTETLTEPERASLIALIDEWRHDPFNPHLIARHRIAAYQKFVVMKYLDNLIAWADQLFRQDTFETINEATQLYVLADELLGGRPEVIEPVVAVPRMTFRELEAKGIDDFANAILEVESLMVSNRPYLKDTDVAVQAPAILSIKTLALRSFYFTIPRNERLDKYWDVVDDRLFKIRNSMSIDGIKRRLSLFEPPIDPALLVRAAAAGLDLGAVLAQLNTPLPNYRFQIWIQKATELVNELKSFGAALLAALEKTDGEALSLLRQGQEIRMLELVRKVREQQIKEAEENIAALELSRALAEERLAFYSSREKVSVLEFAQLGAMLASTVLEAVQAGLHGVSGAMAAIPDSLFGAVGPFPTGLASLKIGTAAAHAASEGANGVGIAASITRNLGAMSGTTAGFERRWDDWKLQERLARKEIEQINQQIVIANIRLDIATKELENHEQQIAHAEELLEFLQDKFTNRELYQWMVTKLSSTYRQFYKLTYDTAKTAERTFEFELGLSNTAFIRFEYVDSLRQGLLAGEQLICDLKRLELAHLERNKRELEIQKSISLAEINGAALQQLRELGYCELELPEVLFDLDFPGQYFRRIKSVRVTIPCVTGPHTSVSAKLTLLRSAYRKEAGIGSLPYPLQGANDDRFVQDPIGIKCIATSRAQGDSGLFELNFRDERYLPFEGAGAISRWKLELPNRESSGATPARQYRQFDYHTISDVVVDISYTAREAGGPMKVAAESSIEDALNRIRALSAEDPANGLIRVFSLKREFPDALHSLLASSSAALELLPQHFPFLLRQAGLDMQVNLPVEFHVVPRLGAAVTESMELGWTSTALERLSLSSAGIGTANLTRPGTPNLLSDWAPETWTLSQSGMTAAIVDDVVVIVQYQVS